VCLDSVMSELYLKWLPFLDLWTLPNARLTSTLATEIEENFYARCPPELRPDLRHSQSSGPSVSAKKEETRSESVTPSTSVEDKEKREDELSDTTTKWWSWFQMKPKIFKTDSAGNKKYDSSLLKALHRTFFVRWWTGGILLLLAGEFHCTIFVCQTLTLILSAPHA
jgi:ATP-binding cassette, subfamily C (CFTR/MRP), member 1